MKAKLKAEMWDKTQYLFRNYYDRMMHCALYYDGEPDADALRRALTFQIERVPVLHSRYHNNPLEPYWTVEEWNIDDVLRVERVDEIEPAVMAFVEQRIPIESNTQLRVGLFLAGGKSALAVVVNHMCFDVGDLKYFVIKLCETYTKLVSGDQNMEI